MTYHFTDVPMPAYVADTLPVSSLTGPTLNSSLANRLLTR